MSGVADETERILRVKDEVSPGHDRKTESMILHFRDSKRILSDGIFCFTFMCLQ
jgi:hypothetical protein